LSSKPSVSEVFIREKIKGLQKNKLFIIDCYYDDYFQNIGKLRSFWFFFKSFYSFTRLLKFYYGFDNSSSRRRFAQVFLNLPLLTSKRRYDFLHYGFANLICNRAHLGKVIGAKTSLSIRGYDVTYFPINHPGCYDGVWKYVDKIQYNSHDLYVWALKWGADPNTPSTHIPAAVNDEFIAKKRIHTYKSKFKFASIGRLHWKKGIDFALLALHEIKAAGIEFEYSIYGIGPETEKLDFLIERLGLRENVNLRGFLKHSEIPDCLDKIDVLIVPSLQEGCSNIALEAQARGCYCVAFDSEGMNSIIKDNVSGKIVPIGDWKSLSSAVIEYSNLSLEDYNIRSQFAIEFIKNNFSRSTQIQKWVEFYR
jgi:colanic acid/amylovoran biosynthesis glycosyltransferase